MTWSIEPESTKVSDAIHLARESGRGLIISASGFDTADCVGYNHEVGVSGWTVYTKSGDDAATSGTVSGYSFIEDAGALVRRIEVKI
jgi:hypothetical protein